MASDSEEVVQRVWAEVLLSELHAAGWRIVRVESAGLWEDPRFEGPYNEDERRPDDAYELFAITDEWTPTESAPDPEGSR